MHWLVILAAKHASHYLVIAEGLQHVIILQIDQIYFLVRELHSPRSEYNAITKRLRQMPWAKDPFQISALRRHLSRHASPIKICVHCACMSFRTHTRDSYCTQNLIQNNRTDKFYEISTSNTVTFAKWITS